MPSNESSTLDSTQAGDELIEGLDDSEQESSDYLYPIDRDKIKVTVNNMPISTIIDYIRRKKIELQPIFQRTYVWNDEKAAGLIDSIWKGLPIPQIFLLQKEDGKSLVIDGQQRLTSISRFILSEEELLSVLPNLSFVDSGRVEGLKLKVDKNIFYPQITFGTEKIDFSELGTIEQDKFETESMIVAVIQPTYSLFQGKREDVNKLSREIFHRLNTGGVKLSPQEIRQSLYSGSFMSELQKISFSTEWKNLLPRNVKRFKDDPSFQTEMLIRAMAFLDAYGDKDVNDTIGIESFSYFKPLDKFLDKYSEISYQFSSAQIESRISLLNKALVQLNRITDHNFFRHQIDDGDIKAIFNIKYIDTLFVGVLNLLRHAELTDAQLNDKINSFKTNRDTTQTYVMVSGGGDITYTENRVMFGINKFKE
ncbi:DUF262 domain-containing protein [Candidatus Gracilibacteria bacterium]|nr:DUF262 domain-containing protein [Candidatus Gracilibacteria bacterium]